MKKSSFKSKKNEKIIKENNTIVENDKDYKLDGLEIHKIRKEKEKTNQLKVRLNQQI